MKIKIGLNDCLRDKTNDREISFLALLEDDQYFNKKINELRKEFKNLILHRNKVKTTFSYIYPKELIDLDKYTKGGDYLEKVGKFCSQYKDCPFEMIYSVRSLIENKYWIPTSNWFTSPVSIKKGKDVEINVFNESDIFIQISKDVGITKLKLYLEKVYKNISKHFEEIDLYKYKLKGVNQDNLEINKRVFCLRNQSKFKWVKIAEIINNENIRAHYTDKTINRLYIDYIKSIRKLRK